ncbi:MAG: type II secretion system F family protein [Candidatus Omnitrophota bacterium]
MAVYIYKAVDRQGKIIKGEMEASSEMDLTTKLAKSGYLAVNISFKPVVKASDVSFGNLFKKKPAKVDPQNLVIFTRQFATIVKAAVPLIEGLGILAEQTEDRALKPTLHQVVHDVEGGHSLSQAMSKHPGVFSELYVNTVIAGESAGILDKVLLRLSTMLEDDTQTRANIMAALRYPIMVVIALVIAVFVLSTLIVPQFAKIYREAKVALPLPTQVMIVVSNILLGPWRDKGNVALILLWFVIILGIFGGFFFFLIFLINTKQGRFIWDGWKFKLMIVGKVYTKITMLRFASMLNVLYQSGLPVLKTLDIVGMTIGNVVLTREIEEIKRDVSDGKGISGAVLNSKFFPRLVGYMISVGERSGSLPMMLDSLCDYFNLEVKTIIRNLTTMIEPVMTAVLGTVVMFMALAIFLPLWSLIQVFKG